MLAQQTIERVLQAALEQGGEFAEIFVEDRHNTTLGLVGGTLEDNLMGLDYGVGIRVIDGLKYAYAFTNDTREERLIEVAREAALTLKKSDSSKVLDLRRPSLDEVNPIKVYPRDIHLRDKVALLREAYESAKDYDASIIQATVSYTDWDQKVLIANSKGLLVEDRRVRTRFTVRSVASNGVDLQTGTYSPGASLGFEYFDHYDINAIAREASRMAKVMAFAGYAPSGVMPVVMDNGFGGVLFHEACGHGLEASFVSKGISVYTGKEGERIASELVTAIDDGTVPNGWGSLTVDDEGTPTTRNVLIEKGVLKNYMVDHLTGKRLGKPSTGACRRESYKFAPTSRMTNTFIDKGETPFDEIIKQTERGLYAKSLGGGSVDVVSGEFNFAVMEGDLIENGEITKPVRGASLIGKGLEVLQNIDMVSSDLTLSEGMCGAASGSIPAGLGQPPLRVKALKVGGRDE